MEGPQAADAGVGPSTKPLRGRGDPVAAAGIARTEMSILPSSRTMAFVELALVCLMHTD